MAPYRPLSKHGVHDPDLDGLHEGFEPWMRRPLVAWGRRFWLLRNGDTNQAFFEDLEVALRVREAFTTMYPYIDLERRLADEPAFGMDVIGFCLDRVAVSSDFDPDEAEHTAWDLDAILEHVGSAWQVSHRTDPENDETRWFLSRRDLEAAKNAITQVAPVAERPAQFLTTAWSKVATREPDPNGAYDNAIKAVEAAAHSVVSPTNAKATLGTMIRDLKAKPEKWTFALGDLGTVIAMAETLWTNHFRHGTQQRDDHTLAEADAAVHLAIPLVRYFAGGLVTLV